MSSVLRTLFSSVFAGPRGYSAIPTSSAIAVAQEEEEELYRISSSPLDNKPLPPTPRQISALRLLLQTALFVATVVMFFVIAAGVFTFLRAFGSEGADEGVDWLR